MSFTQSQDFCAHIDWDDYFMICHDCGYEEEIE